MDISKKSEKLESRIIRIVNSSLCFSIAFIIINYLFHFSTGLVGRLFNFDSTVYYYGTKFVIGKFVWTRYKVVLVYSAGTFFTLILGGIMYLFYYRFKHKTMYLNLFFLWYFVISMCVVSAQSIVADLGINEYNSPFYQNLAAVYQWMWIHEVFVWFLTIPFGILLFYSSVNVVQPFLSFAYSFTKVNKTSRRRKYFMEIAIYPFIIGSVVTTLLTFPWNLWLHVIYIITIALCLIIGWVSLYYIEIQKDYVYKYKNLQKWNLPLILVFIVAVVTVIVTFHGFNLAATN